MIKLQSAAGMLLALAACAAPPEADMAPSGLVLRAKVVDPESAYRDSLAWLGAEREGLQTDGSVVRCMRGVRAQVGISLQDELVRRIKNELGADGFTCGTECEAMIGNVAVVSEQRLMTSREACAVLEKSCTDYGDDILCNFLCSEAAVWTGGMRAETRKRESYVICGRGGKREKFPGHMKPW